MLPIPTAEPIAAKRKPALVQVSLVMGLVAMYIIGQGIRKASHGPVNSEQECHSAISRKVKRYITKIPSRMKKSCLMEFHENESHVLLLWSSGMRSVDAM